MKLLKQHTPKRTHVRCTVYDKVSTDIYPAAEDKDKH